MSHEKQKIQDIKSTDTACANCIYFEKFPIQKKEDNILGACKANPPHPANDYNDFKLGQWPLVLGTFWCGMFGSNSKIETETK